MPLITPMFNRETFSLVVVGVSLFYSTMNLLYMVVVLVVNEVECWLLQDTKGGVV